MHRVCVFCGSGVGVRPAYAAQAEELGRELVVRGLGLVYGGGDVGLMGVIADAVLAAGGEVIGVIPEHLVRREVAHGGLTDLRVVGSMHERKALMAELSDGFVAMPGGLGTFEELFEVVTWSQLGLHEKPVGLLDVDGFFGPLVRLLEHAVAEGFIRSEHRDLLLVEREPSQLLDALAAHRPLGVEKTFDRRRT